MSDKKFTPGPWRQDYRDLQDILAKHKDGSALIATAYCDHRFSDVRYRVLPDEAIANARLIAAAPDMHAALIECQKYFSNRPGNQETQIAEICGAALAKAEAPNE